MMNEFIKKEIDTHSEFIGFMTLHQDLTEEEVEFDCGIELSLSNLAHGFLNKSNYLEARLGLYGGACADFTALYNWHLMDFDWTPSVGKWYFDAGVGGNIGGAAHFVFGGVAGQAKLGLKFNKVPIRLALDWTPVLGVCGWYGDAGDTASGARFYGIGWANVGVSATWCF